MLLCTEVVMRLLNSIGHLVTQTAEQFRNFFDEFSNLPWLNDAQTFEFVNLVKTHKDEDYGARIVNDSDDPFDSSVNPPEFTSPFKFCVWFVVVMRFASVHHVNQIRVDGGVISSLMA